jgi:hypothetical protein
VLKDANLGHARQGASAHGFSPQAAAKLITMTKRKQTTTSNAEKPKVKVSMTAFEHPNAVRIEIMILGRMWISAPWSRQPS